MIFYVVRHYTSGDELLQNEFVILITLANKSKFEMIIAFVKNMK